MRFSAGKMAAAAVAATVAAKKGNALDAFLKRHGDNVVGGVFKLRGQNEELQENDLAHEGFGTVEDKYAEKPLSKAPSALFAARHRIAQLRHVGTLCLSADGERGFPCPLSPSLSASLLLHPCPTPSSRLAILLSPGRAMPGPLWIFERDSEPSHRSQSGTFHAAREEKI